MRRENDARPAQVGIALGKGRHSRTIGSCTVQLRGSPILAESQTDVCPGDLVTCDLANRFTTSCHNNEALSSTISFISGILRSGSSSSSFWATIAKRAQG